jgi:hypothetical protein
MCAVTEVLVRDEQLPTSMNHDMVSKMRFPQDSACKLNANCVHAGYCIPASPCVADGYMYYND